MAVPAVMMASVTSLASAAAGQVCRPGRVRLSEAAPVASAAAARCARGRRGGRGQVAVEAVEIAELFAARWNEIERCDFEYKFVPRIVWSTICVNYNRKNVRNSSFN